MSRTISGTTSVGVTLTSLADNPVSVTGTIAVASGDALSTRTGAAYSWTIDNAGRIATGSTGVGVFLGDFGATIANGVLTNESTGTIASGGYGVFANGPATVTNAGTITAAAFKSVYVRGGAGTVVNSGLLQAGNVGVYLYDGGRVTNLAGGTITGAGGVWFEAPGTLSNAGVVIGTNSGLGSVLFNSNAGENRLIAYPGASFSSKISALAGGANVIQLASAASTGTLSGFGTSITNFGTIEVDPGASWLVSGNAAGLGTIHGFSADDTIDLNGFAAVTAAYSAGSLVLINAGSAHTTLHFAGSAFDTSLFSLASDGAGGTDITVACFAAGTRIATPDGPVPVEALKAGDLVVSALGGAVPIVWIGHRHIACHRHPWARDVTPVRIRAHAFGPGMPAADIRLSPDHSVHVDDVLIPVRLLINGATIVQEPAAAVTYFHVELPTHDIIIAEGLTVESYLDTGNRDAFANGGPAVALYPDFARQIWETESCALLVLDGPRLAQARADLRDTAIILGYALTEDPALVLLVDGQTVPGQHDGTTWHFTLPQSATTARLRSGRFQPARILPDTDDDRELGLAIAALTLDGHDIPLDNEILATGWHQPEPGLRWTTGDATIKLANHHTLTLTLRLAGCYWGWAAEEASQARALPSPRKRRVGWTGGQAPASRQRPGPLEAIR